MSNKRFYVDEKVTIWRRTWYSTENEMTTEQIVESVKDENNNTEVEYSELIYETEMMMTPQENDGQSTIEIFSEDNKILWSNEVPFQGTQNL